MVPYLLEKGGGIFHIGRQIMKVPGSQELSMDEFLDDIFKSKRKYSYAHPLGIEGSTSCQETVGSPNYKE